MSDYHILSGSKDGNKFRIVVHFQVPDVTNEASVNYRTAIVQYQGGAPIQSRIPEPGEEQTKLDAGELYETETRFNTDPSEDLQTKRNKLDALFTSENADVQVELAQLLSYWGFARDVP